MKVIIAGSRSIGTFSLVQRAVEQSGFDVTTVISGGCSKGVDRLGEDWALANQIPCEVMKASWHLHGAKAGMLRNAKMADRADALIAIWDGVSKGTANMISNAKKRGLPCYVLNLPVVKTQPLPVCPWH
jgi:hypothetical protein